MHDLTQLAKEVLDDGFVMSLGTVDEAGVWVADLVYVHDDDFNLYWISLPSSRHSHAIEKNQQVACTIHASVATDKEQALQIAGTAVRLDGPQPELQAKLGAKEGRHVPESDAHRVDKDKVWYKLTSTLIELTYNEHFGYVRQRVFNTHATSGGSIT